jgi:Transposase IS4
MCLEKKQSRGTSKLSADKQNRVLAMQWVDSKVVNMVTTYCDTSLGSVKRFVGPIRMTIPCPRGMIRYQDTMYAVDKGDQKRAHFGGFSVKAHFKKWYKKQFLGILDCMLMNGHVGWNMSAEEKKSRGRNELKRHEYMMSVAESMLDYKEEPLPLLSPKRSASLTAASMEGHLAMEMKTSGGSRCIVCRLECSKGLNSQLGEVGLKASLSECAKCLVTAHNTVFRDSTRQIHRMDRFKNMTCFQILHSMEGLELWPMRQPLNHTKGPRCLKTSHPIYKELRVFYGKPPNKRRRISASTTTTNSVNGDADDSDSD